MTTLFGPHAQVEEELPWPIDRDHISASSLKTYRRCPELWRRVYLCGDRQAPAAALILGASDHHAIADNMTHKLETTEDRPVPDVQEVFATDFERRYEEVGGPTEVSFNGKATGDKKKAAADHKDMGVKMVTVYREQVCPRLSPISVEEQFGIQMPGLPRLDGRIDLLAEPLVEGEMTVFTATGARLIDRKGKSRMATGMSPEETVQARIYQLVHDLPFELHISTKTAAPAVSTDVGLAPMTPVERERIETYIRQTVAMIAHDYRTIGPDDPWSGAVYDGYFSGGSAACNFCAWRDAPGDLRCYWWRDS